MKHPAAIVCFALISLSPLCNAQTQEWEVQAPTAQSLTQLTTLGFDVHPISPLKGRVYLPASQAPLAAMLGSQGRTATLLHGDLETYYASRLSHITTDASVPDIGQGSVGGFLNLIELETVMDSLQSMHPGIMAPKTQIGTSIEGRSIWMWKISDNVGMDELEPEVLVDGMHHAREVITLETVVHFARYLVQNYGVDPEVTQLVDGREIFLIPLVNPDGHAYNIQTNPNGGGLWRKNRRNSGGGNFGVDLNRNYGYQWGLNNGSSGSPSSLIYRGTAAFSEPETCAIEGFALSRDFALSCTLHSFGPSVFLPIQHQGYLFPPAPYEDRYNTWRRRLRERTPGYPVDYSWRLLSSFASGSTIDWMYGALYGGQKTTAFEIELGTPQDGFWPSTARIEPIASEGINYLMEMLHIAGTSPELANVSWVENGGMAAKTWEPTETIGLQLTVCNKGSLDGVITAHIESSSPYLTIAAGNSASPILAPLASATLAPLNVTVQPSAPPGTLIAFDIVLTSSEGVESRVPQKAAILQTHQTPITLDFETPTGWTVGSPQDFGGGAWVRDNPIGTTFLSFPFNPEDDHTPAPGVNCWFTGQGTVGGSVIEADVDGITTLTSPRFSVAALDHPILELTRWFATEDQGTLIIQLSNNDGASWVTMESLMESRAKWTVRKYELETFLPRTDAMRLRLRASVGTNNGVTEAGLDDLKVTGWQSMGTLTAATPVVGTAATIDIAAPQFPSATALLGVSTSAQIGIPVGATLIPLDPDQLFYIAYSLPNIFPAMSGTLDAAGTFQSQFNIPSDPALIGLKFYVAGAVIGPGGLLLATSGAHHLTIQ